MCILYENTLHKCFVYLYSFYLHRALEMQPKKYTWGKICLYPTRVLGQERWHVREWGRRRSSNELLLKCIISSQFFTHTCIDFFFNLKDNLFYVQTLSNMGGPKLDL